MDSDEKKNRRGSCKREERKGNMEAERMKNEGVYEVMKTRKDNAQKERNETKGEQWMHQRARERLCLWTQRRYPH